MELPDEGAKQRQLDRMKRIATGLLLAAAVVFVIARILEHTHPWVGFVRATAEAAMVGAIADWFAVTALFRYPLGIRIPHTAIVPNRKDRIGASLGRFVENNFLSPEVLGDRLRSMQVAERVSEWLQKPESAERLAAHATSALGMLVQALPDAEMESLIERNLGARINETEATPLLADALALVLSENRRRELLDGTLGLLERLLDDNRDELRDRIEREIPWWIPSPIDEKIYQKILTGTESAIHEVRTDGEHPIRHRFDELVDASVEKLKSSPDLIARGEALKREFLGSTAIESFSNRLWKDLKSSLVPTEAGGTADLREPIEQAVAGVGRTLRADDVLLAEVNEWAERAVLSMAEEYRHEVAQLISTTVAQWDPNDTSRKIELQVGKDLQFIRINGTLVGGLVGLIIHTVSQFL